MLFSFVASGENPNFHLQSLKSPPPKTPDKCDPDLSFDAVTELQQEVVFFKDRCVFPQVRAFFSVEDHWFTPELSDFADSCGESIPVLLKHASLSSAACGQTLYRLTWMLCMRTWRKTLFYFSKVRHDGMRTLDRSSSWVLKRVSPELQAHMRCLCGSFEDKKVFFLQVISTGKYSIWFYRKVFPETSQTWASPPE